MSGNGHSVSESPVQEDDVPVLRSSKTAAPYTTAADARVTETVRQQAPKPNAAWTPEQKQELLFSESLQDYQFFRYDDYKSKQVKRFGKQSFDFNVLVKDTDGHTFAVHFNGNLKQNGNSFELIDVQTDHPEYSLEGRLTDGKDTSIGNFKLKNQGRQVMIFLRSYKTKMEVHTRSSVDLSASPELKAKIERFKQETEKKNVYAWATNMVSAGVTVGVSRFHYDILKIVDPGKKDDINHAPLFSFDGESVQTQDIDGAPATVQSTKGDISDVKLRGDAQDDDSRVFSMKVKDSKGQTADVMIEFDRDSDAPEMALGQPAKPVTPTPPPALTPDESDPPASMDDDWVLPDSFGTPVNSEPAVPLRPSQPKPSAPSRSTPPPKTKPVAPAPRPTVNTPAHYRGIGQNAYFFTDYGNSSLPRTKHAIDDFEKNFDVPQVQQQFAIYKRSRGRMSRWFDYATPFIPLIESIAKTYDVPPAFVFLTVRESSYFSGPIRIHGKSYPAYSWANPSTTSAVGPFQIEVAASHDCNLGLGERNYFAPSACGAACYLGNQMRLFPSDYALGILAYYQGAGVKNKILAKARYYNDFSFGYASIARHHMLGADPIQYVAEVLAAYFVSGDYRAYGFSREANPQSLAEIPSALPKGSIRSQKCESAINRGS